jgi:DNA polymerase III subunit delta
VTATGGEATVLVLWGESDFLLREAALEAFGYVRPTELDAREWTPGATADLATPSLFGESRGLLVTEAQELTDDGAAEVARYAAAPAPEARLVLTFTVGPRAKGPPRGAIKALGDAVKVRRVAVERRELPEWVRRRAAGRGLRASPAGANALIQTLGEDPAVLDQAVEQLQASHPDLGLTPESVAAQFRGLGDRRIWELCDAAFTGDAAGATLALAGMLEAGDEPLVLLGGIASRLRDLIRVSSLPPRIPPAEVARAAGLRFDWQARRYRDQSRRYTPEQLAALHREVAEADRLLKQGGTGDVVLPVVVSRIAGAEQPRGVRVRSS